MIRLMKKFSWIYIFYTLLSFGIIFPLFNHDRITGPSPQSLSFSYYLAHYLFLILFGAIWSLEQFEAKQKGMEFLRNLPVTVKQIVEAKLILVFFTIGINVIFTCAAFRLIFPRSDDFTSSCSIYILAGSACLVLSTLLYLGIFRYGFRKFQPWLLTSWLLFLVAPLLFQQFLFPRMGIETRDVILKLTGLNWPFLALGALGLTLVLTKTSIHTLKELLHVGTD